MQIAPPMTRRLITRLVALLGPGLLAGAVAGCPEPTAPEPPVPTRLVLSLATLSLDAIGATQQVTATVLDQRDDPMIGEPVTWVSNSPGVVVQSGSSAPSRAPAHGGRVHVTGATVMVQAAANGTGVITATAGILQATLSVTVLQRPLTPLKVQGDLQTGAVGTQLPLPIQVRVVDRLGVSIVGVTVTFAITQGGGSLGVGSSTTGPDGIASESWTLGQSASLTPQLSVTVQDGPGPAVFTATALAGPPANVAIGAGQGQSALVGAPVLIPPSVTVTDGYGNPVPGAAVAFVVQLGGGDVAGSNAVTSPAGIASVGSWTLGTVPGPNTLTAAVTGLQPAAFTATALVGPPATLAVQAGQGQNALFSAPVQIPPAVLVRDQFGNPVPSVVVSFAVTGGGGAVAGGSATTNPAGIAAVASWTLGPQPGPNALTATLGTLVPVLFAATAVAPPSVVTVLAGDGQIATAGSDVVIPPSVRVTDAFGNPVPNVPVSFQVTGAGGSVTGGNQVTDGSGVATVGRWTLGTVAGPNTLTATVAGLAPGLFGATGVAGPAASVAVNGGDNQSAPAGSQVPIAPSVVVRDAHGNPVAGAQVLFAVTGGGGSVLGAIAATNPSGVAVVGSWTLGATPGPNTMSATVAGLSPVTFSATGTGGGGVPTTMTANGGMSQAALPGSPVATPPSVIVRGAGNLPVPGVTVTFAVIGGGGSITGATAVTDGNGIAAVGSWTLGAGANCLNASVAEGGVSGNPVAFAATGIPAGGPGYDVHVQYLTCVTPSQEAAFASAAARWGTLITGDLADLVVSTPPGSCGSNAPELINRLIDDLLIYATIEPIDGPGAILGSAGPCFIRSTGNLPIIGRMRFDVADVANLQASGQFTNVILHEMGHVIGIGSLWSVFGFLQNPSPQGTPLDTYHSGPNALIGFNTIGGSTYTGGNKVPVENMFGSGTRNVHWRESVLANELMTGFLNSSSANPLSELTVRSLQDFGYAVNPAAADPFFLVLTLRMEGPPEVLIQLHDDVWFGPLYRVDRTGRITRVW